MSDASLHAVPQRKADGRPLIVLFTATIFLSASLLFFVQPLFAKLVLPTIGGAPAVWTTAMLFFQSVLIVGYLYAHLMVKYVPVKAQVWIHLSLWALALIFLPLSMPTGWTYDPEGSTALQTLVLFALGVGVPFAVLSANAPLIQAWYRGTGAPSGDDPYFLYGASNLGSMVALLAFPLVAEPIFGATKIGQGWAIGFLLLGACFMTIGLVMTRAKPAQDAPKVAVATDPVTGINVDQIAKWLLLAFVPSSLMLAVTTKISTDMGTIPMFWVVPLAIYLATFVFTFTNKPVLKDTWLRYLHLLSVVFLCYVFYSPSLGHAKLWLIGLLVLAFTFITMHCHRQLYLARPGGAHLTVFYLVMSIGGAFGGLFNSLLAPAVFDTLREGAATVVLAAMIPVFLKRPQFTAATREKIIFALSLAIVGFLALTVVREGTGPLMVVAGLTLLMAILCASRMLALIVSCGAITLIGAMVSPPGSLFQERSFFGSHLVMDKIEDGHRIYQNGTTMHGIQSLSELTAERPTPLSYYHPDGPMAQVLQSDIGKSAAQVGIVGLGVGSLACYRQPDQFYHFYEIDVVVDQVARDPSLFTYMSACAADMPTHLGDARVVLEGQTDLQMEVLIIDAYSSDAVPVHLTTTEAMQLYTERLTEDGVLVYHISNRYYEIERPLARSAEHLGLNAWIRVDRITDEQKAAGAASSTVVMLAAPDTDVSQIVEGAEWTKLSSDGERIWTDDFANPLGILQLGE